MENRRWKTRIGWGYIFLLCTWDLFFLLSKPTSKSPPEMSFPQHSQPTIPVTQISSASIENEHSAWQTAGHDLTALFYNRGDPASKPVISFSPTGHSFDVKPQSLGDELTATIPNRMSGLNVHRRPKSHSVSTKKVSGQRNEESHNDSSLTDLSFPPSRFEHVFVPLLLDRERRYSC